MQLVYLPYSFGTFNQFLYNISDFINMIFIKFKKRFLKNKLGLEDLFLL